VHVEFYSTRDMRSIVIPVYVWHPANTHVVSSCLAVIDTGSQMSCIDPDLALRELRLPLLGEPMDIFQPSPDGGISTSVDGVRLNAAVGHGPHEIRRPTSAALITNLDRDPKVRLLLGMDFLCDLHMTYGAGPRGALFGIFEAP